jgi:hypothetical protein
MLPEAREEEEEQEEEEQKVFSFFCLGKVLANVLAVKKPTVGGNINYVGKLTGIIYHYNQTPKPHQHQSRATEMTLRPMGLNPRRRARYHHSHH